MCVGCPCTFPCLSHPVLCVPFSIPGSPFPFPSAFNCFSRFPFFAPVGGGHLAAIFVSLSLHFPPKTSTEPKFSSLPSSFPSRPFVFRLYITCSGKTGGISRTFRFLFPCHQLPISSDHYCSYCFLFLPDCC